jgi:hypothetical protein
MAMTFAGFTRWTQGAPIPADIEEVRRTGTAPESIAAKARALLKNLPPTAKLLASYQIQTHDLISILIVEAETVEDLRAINRYYVGWLDIDWYPTNVLQRD